MASKTHIADDERMRAPPVLHAPLPCRGRHVGAGARRWAAVYEVHKGFLQLRRDATARDGRAECVRAQVIPAPLCFVTAGGW